MNFFYNFLLKYFINKSQKTTNKKSENLKKQLLILVINEMIKIFKKKKNINKEFFSKN